MTTTKAVHGESQPQPYTILLFYKYADIQDPADFAAYQRELLTRLSMKGRVIVAKEGINATVEGTTEAAAEYQAAVKADPKYGYVFADVHWKKSGGDGRAFPRLSVKVRDEIVSGYFDKAGKAIDPRVTTGKRLSPDELHEWLSRGEDVTIVDMRNNYEYKVGHFRGSIDPGMDNFRDLPKVLPQLESLGLKDKKVLTVCTGGIRCEKASGFLVANGFKDVYQLDGGIVSYMERYPGHHFDGSLYVFDGRIVMHFDDKVAAGMPGARPHTVVGRCDHCAAPSERYVNCADNSCHVHFICCERCEAVSGAKCKKCEQKVEAK